MIEEVQTRRLLATEVLPVTSEDLRSIGPGWNFDWLAEVGDAEVLKLIATEAPETIHGLMALKRREDHIEVKLLESSPPNVGRDKPLKGVAGSLLAYAAGLSRALGHEGFVTLTSKTELIQHYERAYGFVRQGNSQKMILFPVAAVKLIATFNTGVA